MSQTLRLLLDNKWSVVKHWVKGRKHYEKVMESRPFNSIHIQDKVGKPIRTELVESFNIVKDESKSKDERLDAALVALGILGDCIFGD
jgi:hypothetical protein